MPKASKGSLETELQGLKTRRAEIARELADAQADEATAKEAVINGASTVEFQTARAKVAGIEALATELDRRIQQKERELTAINEAALHAQKVDLIRSHFVDWTERYDVAKSEIHEIISAVLRMPTWVPELIAAADEHQALVELAKEHGVAASEVGMSFDRINAASLFIPLIDALEARDNSALSQLFQHYLRFASLGDTSSWSHLKHDKPPSPSFSQEGGARV